MLCTVLNLARETGILIPVYWDLAKDNLDLIEVSEFYKPNKNILLYNVTQSSSKCIELTVKTIFCLTFF